MNKRKNILKPSQKKRGAYNTAAKKAAAAAAAGNNSTEISTNISPKNTVENSLKDSAKIDFSDLKKEYTEGLDNKTGGGEYSNESEREGEQKQQTENLNLTGKALIGLVDSVTPVVIAFILKIATKGKKQIDPESIRLSKIEREELSEVADAAAQQLLGGLTPVELFIFTMAGIYASKSLSNIKTKK